MQELFSQLGINAPLLIGQGINFLLVFIVLTFFAYRPLMRMLHERRAKIEQGVRDAQAAEERLGAIETERERVLADASKDGAHLIARAESDARTRREELIQKAEAEAERIAAHAHETAKLRQREEEEHLHAHAKELLSGALASAVRAAPDAVDAALIKEAEVALAHSSERLKV